MIRILSALLAIFCTSICFSQTGELLAKTDDGKMFLEHKVAPRESFFAIGRLYNVSPKYLAAYNKLDLNKGLKIDQKIKVPLTDTNFIQTGNTGAPVFYRVGDKEGLSSVSKKNNGVKLADLRSWNQLSTDILKKDTKLVVGFLKGSGFKSVTVNVKTRPDELPPPPEQKNVIEDPEPVKEKKPETKTNDAPPVFVPPVKEEIKPVTKPQSPTTPLNEGHFKTDFEKQTRITPVSINETVTSGVFKTNSGWEDFKYYLLIDKVSPGTIVKLTNPSNGKVCYAKVLGEMSGIRQNAGLNIRISNAAAANLGVAEDDKFILKISY